MTSPPSEEEVMATTLRFGALPVIGALIVSPLLPGEAFASTPASHQLSPAVSAPADTTGAPNPACPDDTRCADIQSQSSTPATHTSWGGTFGGHWDGGAVNLSGATADDGSTAGTLHGRWDGGAVNLSGATADDGSTAGTLRGHWDGGAVSASGTSSADDTAGKFAFRSQH
jgi:hypothetical protein